MPGSGTDWSRHCGTVERDGKAVPAVTKKSFTAAPLIDDAHGWEMLQRQVKRAASTHPWEKKAQLVAHVPMLVQYKVKYEKQALTQYGETIFYRAEKARAWTLRNEGRIARFVKGHGYFSGVLGKLVRYVLDTPGTADALSWHGFETWLKAPTDGGSAGCRNPHGVLLARTGKSVVRVAVVCYMNPSATVPARECVEGAINSECDPFLGQQSDSEEGESDREDGASCETSEGTASVELVPSDASDKDDDEEDADADAALPAFGRAVASYASTTSRENTLKRKIDEAKSKRDVLDVNITSWEDELAQMRVDAHATRMREREEEVDEMMRCARTVARDGCAVDPDKEHRSVVAAYVKDLGEYADPDGKLIEHFKSSKRHERTFTHDRGITHLQGEGYGLGVARPTTAQVRHDYLGVCHERKVVVVMEAKDECTYFNVGVAQMQLTRAEVSLDQVCGDGGDNSYKRFYDAAYATTLPSNDVQDHISAAQAVYWSSMTDAQKVKFFDPIRKALIGDTDYVPA